VVTLPQIVAAVSILGLYWDDHVCGELETAKWRTYALIAATRMFLYITTVTALFHLNNRADISSNVMVRGLCEVRSCGWILWTHR
jgi:hypothetical protein